MDKEKAIDIFNNGDWWNWLSEDIPYKPAMELHDALDLAIATLKALTAQEGEDC